MIEKTEPRVAVLRHRLADGYSDDALDFLKKTTAACRPRVVVLMPADCSAKAEARQVALGADCVLRDPLRLEVLLEYLGKYQQPAAAGRTALGIAPVILHVAGAQVRPHEQRISVGQAQIHVAPQEVELIRLLAHSEGKVIPYPVLYSQIFARRFDGNTTNCRVLLGKVGASFGRLGIDLKYFVQVIPKSGYLYRSTPHPAKGSKNEMAPKAGTKRKTRRRTRH